MDVGFLLRGFVAGVLATFPMLFAEVPAFRRFGRRGVFEWHEIEATLARARGSTRVGGRVVFSLHLLVGGVTGFLFAGALLLLPPGLASVALGLALGMLLWLSTLAVHEMVTGVHPWKNDMGSGPVQASLIGHLLYGGYLGPLIFWL